MKGIQIIDDQTEDALKPDVITNPNNLPTTGNKTAMDVIGDNFDSIMKLATDITEIRKIKVASAAQVAKMDADRKALLAEADAYAKKKNADTNDIVQRMNIIRGMMSDFYAQSNQQITGEDFRIIITEIVNQMGRVEHGDK